MATLPPSPSLLPPESVLPDLPGAAPGAALLENATSYSWNDYGDLSLEATVSLPLQQLTLQEVSCLAPNSVLRSAYHISEDFFFQVKGVSVANVVIEPAGLTRGIRVTNFESRKPVFAPSSISPGTAKRSARFSVPDHLRQCVVPLSLCFGNRSMLLRDAVQLAPGQLLNTDTMLNDPVSLLLGTQVIAYGTPILQSNCYSILITRMAVEPRNFDS